MLFETAACRSQDCCSRFIFESHSSCMLVARMPELGVILHCDVACHPCFLEETP